MEKLKENINETYKTLGINPNENEGEIIKRKEKNKNKITKINTNSDYVNRKCKEQYIINNKMTLPPSICNLNDTDLKSLDDIDTYHTSVKQLNKELITKINDYKSSMNKIILNASNDKLKESYDTYIDIQNNINKQKSDNMLIEQKNSIIDIKLKNSKYIIKIYSFLMIILIIINMGGYMFYLSK
jgi:hypothetical protein